MRWCLYYRDPEYGHRHKNRMPYTRTELCELQYHREKNKWCYLDREIINSIMNAGILTSILIPYQLRHWPSKLLVCIYVVIELIMLRF